MIFSDKITVNGFLQPLIDSGNYSAEQIEEIRQAGLRIFAVGYDIGRLINPKWKPVIQMDKKYGKTIEEFPSALHASRKTGISQGHISRAIRGERSYAGGYLWRLKNLKDCGIG
jgi:hypothetical protein